MSVFFCIEPEDPDAPLSETRYFPELSTRRICFIPTSVEKRLRPNAKLRRCYSIGLAGFSIFPAGGLEGSGNNEWSTTTTQSASTPKQDADGVGFKHYNAQLYARVGLRQNVTIINRGIPSCGASSSFLSLVNLVFQRVAPHVEHAIQIVADEVAKERQLQRLLQAEEEARASGSPIPPVRSGSATNTQNESTAAGSAAPSIDSVPTSVDVSTLKRKKKVFSRFQKLPPCVLTSPSLQTLLPGNQRRSAAERYSLLSANYEGELMPPKIAQEPLPTRAPHRLAGKQKRAEGRAPRAAKETISAQRSFMLRKSSYDLVRQLNKTKTMEPVEAFNNGWSENFRHLSFNGYSSYLILPQIPQLEKIILNFTVDFWLKTDCRLSDGRRTLIFIGERQRREAGMQLHIALNWHPEHGEGVRVYIRDATNRVLECIVPFPGSRVATGQDFHHILIRVRSTDGGGRVESMIDGENVDHIHYVQTEHPATFNAWVHRTFIGANVDDYGQPQYCLRGAICELRFREGDEKVMVRWLLNGFSSSSARLVEGTGSVPEDQREVLHDIKEVLAGKPKACPIFDRLCVNLGTIGPFGDFLHHWSVEICFKTNVTMRSMSLLGVTDRQLKMQQIGIVLNAEPTSGLERYHYHELHTTFFIVDCCGNCVSALMRGSERSNVMVGKWHTLHWKVIDSESNRMEVRIDGQPAELITVCRDSPKLFIQFHDWVCLGGHNVRSWKAKNVFSGYISKCVLTVRGEVLLALPFHEGPGAKLLLDESGHRMHGTLLVLDRHGSFQGGSIVANSVVWIPQMDMVEDEFTQGAGLSTLGHSNFVMHSNNEVALAIVRVIGKSEDSSNTLSESIVDLVARCTVEVQEDTIACFAPHISDMWYALPKTCFSKVESLHDLREVTHVALAWCNDDEFPGHTLVVLAIGDCRLSVLNLSGPHVLRGVPTFDPIDNKWIFGYATNGAKNRLRNMANSVVLSVERVLREASLQPNLALVLGARNLPHKVLNAHDLQKKLRQQSLPWKLAMIFHGLILNTSERSYIHCIQTIRKGISEDEVASVTSYYHSLMSAGEDAASILIQRCWRGRRARRLVRVVVAERQRRNLRVDEILTLRRTDLTVQPKRILHALVITMETYFSEYLPPLTDPMSMEVATGLRKQGYAVDHLRNPTRAVVQKAFQGLSSDTCHFIYLSAYGGRVRMVQQPPYTLYQIHLSMQEETQREELQNVLLGEYRMLRLSFFRAQRDILEAAAQRQQRSRRRRPLPSPARQAKGAAKEHLVQNQLQLQQEELFRQGLEATIAEEEDDRERNVEREEELAYNLLVSVIETVLTSTAQFIANFSEGAPPTYSVVPIECPRMEPFPSDVIDVEELVSRCMQLPATPLGTQVVFAADLTPLRPSDEGAGLVASSTGHRLLFPYKAGQRSVLSWYLRKAFDGYVPPVPIKIRDALLHGASETAGPQRDWRSFATYLVGKLLPRVPADRESLMSELTREVSYVADLVPIRFDPSNGKVGRAQRRAEQEQRRALGVVHFCADATYLPYEVLVDFRTNSCATTIQHIVALPQLLIRFAGNNHGLDGIERTALAAEVQSLLPSEVQASLTISPSGVWVALSHKQPDVVVPPSAVSAITGNCVLWRIPTCPYAHGKELTVDDVQVLYEGHSNSSLLQYQKLQRQRYFDPMVGRYSRLCAVAMEGGAS